MYLIKGKQPRWSIKREKNREISVLSKTGILASVVLVRHTCINEGSRWEGLGRGALYMETSYLVADTADYWTREEMFKKWRWEIYLFLWEKIGFWFYTWKLKKKKTMKIN